MSTMYLAFSGTWNAGHNLGDSIVYAKVADLMAHNEPHDRILLSLHRRHPLNFIFDRFIREHRVEVLWDDWATDDPAAVYAQFEERRRSRAVQGIPFHTYKEFYRRVDGGNRQGQLCGGEKGLGRRNIFEYFCFGQETSAQRYVGSDCFDEGLIYHKADRAATPCRSVFISPYAKSQGNEVFTWDFWRQTIRLLLNSEVTVFLNTDRSFMDDEPNPLLQKTYQSDMRFESLFDRIGQQQLVACGNTGIGWVAAATGTPLMAMEPPFFWYMDYRYRECGARSVLDIFAEPDPARVQRQIIRYLDRRSYYGFSGTSRGVAHEGWLTPFISEGKRAALDVGAGRGEWAMALSPVYRRVICVEPNTACADAIEGLGLPNVDVCRSVAWCHDGPLRFHIYENSDCSGVACIPPHPAAGGVRQSVLLPAEALQDRFDGEAFDLIKIDTEGSEVQVLLGLQKIVERDKPRLIIECHTPENVSWVEQLLKRIGYNLLRVHYPGYKLSDTLRDYHLWVVGWFYR